VSRVQHHFTTMSATPMDIDAESSPAPAEVPQLNITRTLVTNVSTTSAVSDVIANFRPTKVGIPRCDSRQMPEGSSV